MKGNKAMNNTLTSAREINGTPSQFYPLLYFPAAITVHKIED